MNAALESVINQELDSLGFDLVEVRKGGISRRPVFDVRIDRRDGRNVSLDDCATASRALDARIEASGLVNGSYVLEVSSPGVERPIRRVDDWRRFAGRAAKVTSPALGGRVEVEVLGIEGESGEAAALLRDAQGQDHRVPLNAITDAHLIFRWDR